LKNKANEKKFYVLKTQFIVGTDMLSVRLLFSFA